MPVRQGKRPPCVDGKTLPALVGAEGKTENNHGREKCETERDTNERSCNCPCQVAGVSRIVGSVVRAKVARNRPANAISVVPSLEAVLGFKSRKEATAQSHDKSADDEGGGHDPPKATECQPAGPVESGVVNGVPTQTRKKIVFDECQRNKHNSKKNGTNKN